MNETSDKTHETEGGKLDTREADEVSAVSRRQFLKMAAGAGAVVSMGGGLAGLVTACGGEATTTTAATTATTSGATTTSAAETTTSGASSTTVSSTAEAGREVKLGYVSPVTGPLAAFGIPDGYCVERWKEYTKDGLVFGDGKKHPISISVLDTQSDANRTSQVTADLILNTKVDMVMAASTPTTVAPVADQSEALGAPCLTMDAPADAYVFGRGGKPDTVFKWTYHVFWAVDRLVDNTVQLWGAIPTNKVMGVLWPNDPDGQAWRGTLPTYIEKSGITMVDAGLVQPGTEDYTSIISKFKSAGCELFQCIQDPPDFINFWKQAKQQGFNPKIADVSKATLFPASVDALGPLGNGIAGASWWHPTYPFKSSLTGETCAEFALDFEKRTNNQWTQPLIHYFLLEWAVDVLNRTKNLDDKEEIIKNVSTTKMADSIAGPIDFTAPIKPDSDREYPNVAGTPIFGSQWLKATTQNPWSIKIWQYELVVLTNTSAPMVKVQGTLQPLTELQ